MMGGRNSNPIGGRETVIWKVQRREFRFLLDGEHFWECGNHRISINSQVFETSLSASHTLQNLTSEIWYQWSGREGRATLQQMLIMKFWNLHSAIQRQSEKVILRHQFMTTTYPESLSVTPNFTCRISSHQEDWVWRLIVLSNRKCSFGEPFWWHRGTCFLLHFWLLSPFC